MKSWQTDRQTDDGRQVIRKAYLSFQVRWGKKSRVGRKTTVYKQMIKSNLKIIIYPITYYICSCHRKIYLHLYRMYKNFIMYTDSNRTLDLEFLYQEWRSKQMNTFSLKKINTQYIYIVYTRFKLNHIILTMLNTNCCKQTCWHADIQNYMISKSRGFLS